MRDLCSLVYKQSERNVIYFTSVTDGGKQKPVETRISRERVVTPRSGEDEAHHMIALM